MSVLRSRCRPLPRLFALAVFFLIIASCSLHDRRPAVRTDPDAQTLKPFEDSALVSWYGAGFEGKATASGEVFNPNELTAAHRSLAFGTRVEFLNPENKRTVTVRVNDRGPFVRKREFDLSRAAARRLGILSDGVQRLRYRVLGK